MTKDLAKQISSAVVFEFVSDPLFISDPVRKLHLIGVGKIPTQHNGQKRFSEVSQQ